jgi:membrane-associated phospholipid phosphatase
MEASPAARHRGPRAATLRGTTAQLTIGFSLLVVAAVAGLAFVHRPWPNRLDVWGYAALPADSGSRWAHDLVVMGSLPVLIAGVAAVFVVAVFRDWVRAAACATAPVLAVLIVQDLAKPLVGRHLGITGAASYPSGTVAAVAALCTAAALVVPAVIRPLVAVAGAVATVGVCAAVIVLRWHFPTDALGGVAVGAGAVLVVDALFHVPWALANAVSGRRPARRVGPSRRPRPAWPEGLTPGPVPGRASDAPGQFRDSASSARASQRSSTSSSSR